MPNALNRDTLNALARMDEYGRFDIGGPIGIGDIKAQFVQDPMMRTIGEGALDVIPISGEMRSAERVGQQYQAYQNAQNPIQKALRAADMGLEGGSTVASMLPGIKAAGATFGPLIMMMARKHDALRGLQTAPQASYQLGKIGSPTHVESITNYDPGFTHQVGGSSNRVGEMGEYQAVVERDPNISPNVSIADFEGKPYIISMSDRTAGGGMLHGMNGVEFDSPVSLQGGQDYMMEHPGSVWASDPSVVAQMDSAAKALKERTGQNPLFLPWRMTPKGGDFAHMNAETMLKYANANMSRSEARAANKAIQQVIPELDITDPRTFNILGAKTGDQRKAVQLVLDRDFRDKGGLSVTGARLGVADPYQLRAPTGGLQNVGEVFADNDIIHNSGHDTYRHALPGRGIGRLIEDIPAIDLVPELRQRNYGDHVLNPYHQDDAFNRSRRSLETNLYTGILDEESIRRILDAQ